MDAIAIDTGRLRKTPVIRKRHLIMSLLLTWAALMGVAPTTLAQGDDSVDKSPEFDQYMSHGNELFTQQKYPQAREQFLKASQAKPDSGLPLLRTADTYLKQDQQHQALEYYKRAFALDASGQFLAPLYRMGKNFREDRKWDEALDVYYFIFEKKNCHPNYALKVIDVLENMDRHDEVISVCERALQEFDWSTLMKNQREAYRNRIEEQLGKALAMTGQLRPRIEEMLGAWRAAPEKYENLERLQQLCMAAVTEAPEISDEEMGMYLEALLEIGQRSEETCLQLAHDLQSQEKFNQALKILRQARQWHPDNSIFWLKESEIHQKQSNLEQASETAEHAYAMEMSRWEEAQAAMDRSLSSNDIERLESAREKVFSAIANAELSAWRYLEMLKAIGDYDKALQETKRLEELIMKIDIRRLKEERLLLQLRKLRNDMMMTGGMYDEILRSSIEACKQHPTDPQLLEALADQYMQLGEFEVAGGYYLQACKYHESGAELLLRKAGQASRKRDKISARFFLEQYIINFSDHEQIIEALERYKRKWSRKNRLFHKMEQTYANAMQLIEQTAAKVERDSADQHIQAMAAYLRVDARLAWDNASQELWLQTIEDYQRMLKHYPDHPKEKEIMVHMAEIYANNLKDFSNARDMWLEVFHRFQLQTGIVQYAEMCIRLNDASCLEEIEKHLEMHPNEWTLRITLAEAQLNFGDREAAQKIVADILNVREPDNKDNYELAVKAINNRLRDLKPIELDNKKQ